MSPNTYIQIQSILVRNSDNFINRTSIVLQKIFQIAQDVEENVHITKERFGLYPHDGLSEGIKADNPEDCIFWFSNGAYFDPASPQGPFINHLNNVENGQKNAKHN